MCLADMAFSVGSGSAMLDQQRGPKRGGPALEKTYQFLLWLVPKVEKFPRSAASSKGSTKVNNRFQEFTGK